MLAVIFIPKNSGNVATERMISWPSDASTPNFRMDSDQLNIWAPITPKALDYVDDWYYGFSILMAYKAGTYIKGEYPTKPEIKTDDTTLDCLVKNILADYSKATGEPEQIAEPIFRDVYDGYYQYKYKDDTSKTYSKSSVGATQSSYRHCNALHDRIFTELRHDDLQGAVNACRKRHATHEHIVNLLHQMYAYADMKEVCKID